MTPDQYFLKVEGEAINSDSTKQGTHTLLHEQYGFVKGPLLKIKGHLEEGVEKNKKVDWVESAKRENVKALNINFLVK